MVVIQDVLHRETGDRDEPLVPGCWLRIRGDEVTATWIHKTVRVSGHARYCIATVPQRQKLPSVLGGEWFVPCARPWWELGPWLGPVGQDIAANTQNPVVNLAGRASSSAFYFACIYPSPHDTHILLSTGGHDYGADASNTNPEALLTREPSV